MKNSKYIKDINSPYFTKPWKSFTHIKNGRVFTNSIGFRIYTKLFISLTVILVSTLS